MLSIPKIWCGQINKFSTTIFYELGLLKQFVIGTEAIAKYTKMLFILVLVKWERCDGVMLNGFIFVILSFLAHETYELRTCFPRQKCARTHLRQSDIQKFSQGTNPRTPALR
jgi:hypothetical protein